MPPFIRALASLKLTTALLVLIALVLSAGTILESLRGTEAAQAVYAAPWFYALLVVFSLNVVAALWDRWPRDRMRIGFVITHASMLLILAGALLTAVASVNGHLALWEGESSKQFDLEKAGHGTLPFTVRLDDFQMDYYPGTRRPAAYRSRITVTDAAGHEQSALIEMNRPFERAGYRLFQSSYQVSRGREMSVLAVSKDPGQTVVFWGYYLLVLGMLVVLVTRIAQFRAVERARAAQAGTAAGARAVVLAIALGALALAGGANPARAAHVPPAADLPVLRRLPVQSDGREMPFDTQAREAVLQVTGQRHWGEYDPVALAMGWTIDPNGWALEPIVKVDDAEAHLASLAAGTKHASYAKLLSSRALMSAMDAALGRQARDASPEAGDRGLLGLYGRLSTLHAFLNGQAILAVPGRERGDAWSVPPNPAEIATWVGLEARVRPGAPSFYPTPAAIGREIAYNAVNPTGVAWWLLLPAAIAAALTLERDRWKLRWVAAAGMVLGFAVMTWGIAVRWQLAGRIPASNMYESMLFLGWGVGLFGVVSLFVRNRMLIYNAAAMSALVMLLLDRLPIDPFIRPMAPVLANTVWLAIHVPIIMVSYSTFAIAAFLGHLVLGARVFAPGRPELSLKWSNLLYWYLLVGSILLIAGILTGSIWAASSWGRYWGWDPKEVWSLIAFLAYMAILHARSDGQIGPQGVAAWSIVAFWTILMTYIGVNFVLGSGLHSYGAGSGNLIGVMMLVALIEAAFLVVSWGARTPPAKAAKA